MLGRLFGGQFVIGSLSFLVSLFLPVLMLLRTSEKKKRPGLPRAAFAILPACLKHYIRACAKSIQNRHGCAAEMPKIRHNPATPRNSLTPLLRLDLAPARDVAVVVGQDWSQRHARRCRRPRNNR
jgi:hypothetical protein